jgi:hypothetical protein
MLLSRPCYPGHLLDTAIYTTYAQVYTGGMPSFEAVDGSGIAVMSKVLGTDPAPGHSGDGGFGSVGDLLLKTSKATGVFRYPACHSTCRKTLL